MKTTSTAATPEAANSKAALPRSEEAGLKMGKSPPMVKTGTPGIYKRGNRYVVVWRHRGRQHKSYHRTYAQARASKAERVAGEGQPDSRRRLGEYFEEWIETFTGRTARGFTDRSRSLYRRSFESHVLERWGRWRLSEIAPSDVRALYLQLRSEGASTSELRRLRAAISALLMTAVEDSLIRSNPVRGVRIPPSSGIPTPRPRAPSRAFTREELSALLAEIPGDWRLFFEFLVHTGLRISEVVALRWVDAELGESASISVREQFSEGQRRPLKSDSGGRDVPLAPSMARRLKAKRGSAPDDGPIFCSGSGTPLNRSNVSARVLKPAAKAVGLTAKAEGKVVVWPSFHSFRHTCASLLFSEGRNVRQVAEWLGHSDPAFTLRTYVHLMDEGVGGADFMDRAVIVGINEDAGNNPGNGAPGEVRSSPQDDGRDRA